MLLRITSIFILLIVSLEIYAQHGDEYRVLRALHSEMNAKFPLLDSLYPIQTINLSGKGYEILKRKEKRKIRKQIGKQEGYKLVHDSLPEERVLIPALQIFQAFRNFDSTASLLIEKTQPFFMVSNPIFFSKSKKAIVIVSLIRGYGNTYILGKNGSEWKILKSIYGWM